MCMCDGLVRRPAQSRRCHAGRTGWRARASARSCAAPGSSARSSPRSTWRASSWAGTRPPATRCVLWSQIFGSLLKAVCTPKLRPTVPSNEVHGDIASGMGAGHRRLDLCSPASVNFECHAGGRVACPPRPGRGRAHRPAGRGGCCAGGRRRAAGRRRSGRSRCQGGGCQPQGAGTVRWPASSRMLCKDHCKIAQALTALSACAPSHLGRNTPAGNPLWDVAKKDVTMGLFWCPDRCIIVSMMLMQVRAARLAGPSAWRHGRRWTRAGARACWRTRRLIWLRCGASWRRCWPARPTRAGAGRGRTCWRACSRITPPAAWPGARSLWRLRRSACRCAALA